MLIQGRVAGLVFAVITIGTMLYGISRAKSKLPTVRKIAGLEAINEAVGRATEMGKAIFCTPGWADITSSSAGATFAALDIIGHVARMTARYDSRLVVAVSYLTSSAILLTGHPYLLATQQQPRCCSPQSR